MISFSIGLSFLSSNTPKKIGHRKLLSAEARRILSLLDGKPFQDNDIIKDENGRPYFPNRRMDFNISHSGDAAAVSLVSGEGLRTGCDIELVRPKVNAREIADKYFSVLESDYIFSIKRNKDIEINFFTIWTLKECYLKLRGLSVFDMRKAPSFICGEDPDDGHFAFDAAASSPGITGSPLSFYVYELKSASGEIYLLSVSIEGDTHLRPEMRCFSQPLLSARSIVEIKAALNPTETVSPKM